MLRVIGARALHRRFLLAGCDDWRAGSTSVAAGAASSSSPRSSYRTTSSPSPADSAAIPGHIVDTSPDTEEESLLVRKQLKVVYLPRKALNHSEISNKQPDWRRQTGSHFSIQLVPLSAQVSRNVALGAPYLRAKYPPGVLEGRHERRRMIVNGQPDATGWREVDDRSGEPSGSDRKGIALSRDSGEDGGTSLDAHSESEDAVLKDDGHELDDIEGWTPRPPSVIASRLEPMSVPIVVLTTKQMVDKRAAVRNRVRTRIVEVLRQVITETEPRARSVLAMLNPPTSKSSMSSFPINLKKGPQNYLKILASDNMVLSTPYQHIRQQMETVIDTLAQKTLPRLVMNDDPKKPRRQEPAAARSVDNVRKRSSLPPPDNAERVRWD